MSQPEASPLGKATAYCDRYAPELLFPIDRQEKRGEIGLSEGTLPFIGEDLWNAYELSWLNLRGKPVVATGEFRFPADSPRLIESKSFKLYLNSFNQEPFGCVDDVQLRLHKDLSQAAGKEIDVRLRAVSNPIAVANQPGSTQPTLIDEQDIDITRYELDAEHLRTLDGPSGHEWLCSHLLKSNCLVTGQPDWGTVYVRYQGPPIDHAGLLRYIVSFRQHNEFHEQCVERMFMDIWRRCRPERLEVWARYTRRGGLDINPWRSSHAAQPPDNRREARQ